MATITWDEVRAQCARRQREVLSRPGILADVAGEYPETAPRRSDDRGVHDRAWEPLTRAEHLAQVAAIQDRRGA